MNVDSKHPPDNKKVSPGDAQKFAAHCYAIASLWQLGEYGNDERALQIAVDRAVSCAPTGMAADAVQLFMARAFALVRDDLGGFKP